MLLAAQPVVAAELSHYSALPGLAFMDDLFHPSPDLGRLFYVQYNAYYTTDTYRDPAGNETDQITIEGPLGRPITVDVDIDVDNWVLAPTLMWAPGWEVLGAKYGGFIMIPVGNPSVAADLNTEIGLGRSVQESQWGLGDVFFQPLWLQWALGEHVDLTAGYGFYAPSGKYEAGAADNVGLGFWAHQLQSAVRVRFDETGAAIVAVTGEINHEKDGTDITPGSHVTLNWGIRKTLFDDWFQVGLAGYDTWQASNDAGSEVTRLDKDEVHAAGVEIAVPKLGIQLKYMHEFEARDRFEGQMVSLMFALPLEKLFEMLL
jgi:hypothetical protein